MSLQKCGLHLSVPFIIYVRLPPPAASHLDQNKLLSLSDAVTSSINRPHVVTHCGCRCVAQTVESRSGESFSRSAPVSAVGPYNVDAGGGGGSCATGRRDQAFAPVHACVGTPCKMQHLICSSQKMACRLLWGSVSMGVGGSTFMHVDRLGCAT